MPALAGGGLIRGVHRVQPVHAFFCRDSILAQSWNYCKGKMHRLCIFVVIRWNYRPYNFTLSLIPA